MDLKEFMKKHKAAFDAYNEALSRIIEKRRDLSKFYWKLGVIIEYPNLNSGLDQSSLYDPETGDQLVTRDQLYRKYREVKEKLAHPIIYDQEYRAAYKALLDDVYEDAVKMTRDAEKAVVDAHNTYKAKEAEYYNKYVDAQNAKINLKRELRVAMFTPHDQGTGKGNFISFSTMDMVVDPVTSNYVPVTCSLKDQIDIRLASIEKLDADNILQDDPTEFQRKYDSEFAKTHPDTIKLSRSLADAHKALRDWIAGGNPVS